MNGHSFVSVVVSPHTLLREGLKHILSAAGLAVATTGATVDEVMASLLAEEQPVFLILDAGGDQDAIVEQVKLFRERNPTSHIALLANYVQSNDCNMVAALRAGADAYFLNPTGDTLVKSAELVMLGEAILPPAVMSAILGNIGGAQAEIKARPDVIQRHPPPA